MSLDLNKIYNIDCIEGLKKIKTETIDLTVTSPPYDNLRNYQKDISTQWNQEVWENVFDELWRVTKRGGVVVWIVGDATINGSETGSSFKQAYMQKKLVLIYMTL